ncbi:uncharacterized protein AMSG_10979 [Thecamonas trahens ATCC 50062]|uniref:Transmembrane protein n=1 Tax=Thecamonas trahens ATCC 50062 TaxID=461836 RepID=A0A0L0DTF1_THETB|nr:hypothetical protein AMSG_10979 [Thecamonas trahens ATCC 50062]KNC55331.1 hypothetical protein AMSG_10979 [Thecamonas trahens ATCC 50062]|eukprot:XP_013753052.1 hypothetical protein AMSG_10979 [Thecamonas trahens ATCC 50062]
MIDTIGVLLVRLEASIIAMQICGTISTIFLCVYLLREGRVSFDEESKPRVGKVLMMIILIISYFVLTAFNAIGFQSALLRREPKISLWGIVAFILAIVTGISVLDMLFNADSLLEWAMFLIESCFLTAELIAVLYVWQARAAFIIQEREARSAGVPVARPAGVVFVDGSAAEPTPVYYAEPVPYAEPVTAEPVMAQPVTAQPVTGGDQWVEQRGDLPPYQAAGHAKGGSHV